MTISAGDRFILAKTADDVNAAMKVTRASAAGDRFILARTADGKNVAIKVNRVSTAGQRFILAKTADGKNVAVNFDFDPGGNLISCASAGQGQIYIHSGITAAISSSFSVPGWTVVGLTFDGTNLISGEYVFGKIYIHSGITATTLSSFASHQSTGLTYTGGPY